MCIKRNYYIAIIHNDYTFPSTRYAHIIAEFTAHLVDVLQNKKELKDFLITQKYQEYTRVKV